MAEPRQDGVIISETDIMFRCDGCSKSLVIEIAGAGMPVTCPDCGKELVVPELEVEEEEQPPQASDTPIGSELVHELSASKKHIQELRALVKELEKHRDSVERDHAENLMKVKLIAENVTTIHQAAENILHILQTPVKRKNAGHDRG
ncbi:MAG: hypothetical protein JXR37_28160 [Kiritimatiellae bacterium]|nr:hypothetical protein [Kiritimatiellia bacterium]